MCGGVIFPYREEYHDMLAKLYPAAELEKFEKDGRVRSLYWQKSDPILPVIPDGDKGAAALEAMTPRIMLWGSRDKDAPFPNTGWARLESIEQGKWRHLRPRPALIPVSFGVEKGRWFTIKHGIAGLIVERDGEERIFMLTRQSNPEFLEATRHERMPVLIEQTDFPWLPGEPGGTISASQTTFPTH
jgi:hypothetical protein